MSSLFSSDFSKIINFSDFYQQAKKIRTDYFLLYYSLKKAEKIFSFKYAVVTSKKRVHKKAVHRNRVRRRLKSAFLSFSALCAQHVAKLPFTVEIQVLFMANKEVLQATWPELLMTVEAALLKIFSKCPKFLEKKDDL